MMMLPSALLLTVSPIAVPPPVDVLHGAAAEQRIVVTSSTPFAASAYLAQPVEARSDGAIAPTPAPPLIVPPPFDAAAPATPTPAEAPRGSEIVITGRAEPAPDPLRAINAEAFSVTQKLDDSVIGPVARSYKKTVPGPIRKGIHNFLYNLREPIVFLNFMLQLKPGKAAETVGRFAINSTIGVAGVVDVAKRKPFRLPRRSNGFANTLGYYGVKNGPFLFLPIVGPTTVRDLFGGAIDRLVLPVGVGKPFTSLSYSVPAGVLGALDHRSEFDKTLKDLHKNSPDPYAASRAFYLNRRQAEIDLLKGKNTGDPTGMSGPPPSVNPFVPSDLEPQTPEVAPPKADAPRD